MNEKAAVLEEVAGSENVVALDDLPDLVVAEGETRTILARVHQFKNVHIKAGGTLVISPNSSRWTILWATGDVVVEGTIIGERFGNVITPIRDRTPDGKQVEHVYALNALGGAGGMGGYASIAGAGSRSGGQGARGTNAYGGGGGSPGGVHIMGNASRLGSNGNSATDWHGAPPANDGGYSDAGGNGGRLASFAHGCPLMIYAEGTFKGEGLIRLHGSDGATGLPGGPGLDSNRGVKGSGGGGGGAPGGEGGRLVLVANVIENDPNVSLDGGRGGAGGPIQGYRYGATPGARGDDGGTGFVDVFSLDQWRSSVAPSLSS